MGYYLRQTKLPGASSGVQLSVVTEKLKVVTNGGRRKLSMMEPPAKGRRGHTFAYTDYASVAIFKLSDHIN